MPPAVQDWADATYQKHHYRCCFSEIEHWDKAGPLLLRQIPGLAEENGTIKLAALRFW